MRSARSEPWRFYRIGFNARHAFEHVVPYFFSSASPAQERAEIRGRARRPCDVAWLISLPCKAWRSRSNSATFAAAISATYNVTRSAVLTGASITLSVTNGRDAIWSGACSSGGDNRQILAVRNAKELSDFVMFTMHNHTNRYAFQAYSHDSYPADFMRPFIHKLIDNGLDKYVGHGSHTMQGSKSTKAVRSSTTTGICEMTDLVRRIHRPTPVTSPTPNGWNGIGRGFRAKNTPSPFSRTRDTRMAGS